MLPAGAAARVPAVLFDTQLAAGFCGYGTPSLASLLQGELGIALPKGDRLTDWLRRPLGADARTYAAADVAHLLPLADRLRGRLGEPGPARLGRGRVRGAAPPVARARRTRTSRGGGSRRRARCGARPSASPRRVGAWRERRAGEVDQPVRFVLPDLALVGIAQKPPADAEGAAPGARPRRPPPPQRRRRRRSSPPCATGLALPKDDYRLPPAGDVDRDLRPAVTLVSAWISQLGRDLGIDTTILATRGDLEAFLRGDADARLATGWRAEAVGDAIGALVGGDAALAFDGTRPPRPRAPQPPAV